jgi:hypothetical protein
MLELTHGRTIDERASMHDPRRNPAPEAVPHTARRDVSRAREALNYWQLRALWEGRPVASVEFSERICCTATLQADWNFRGRDAMKRSRAVVSGSQTTAQSV